MATSPEALWQMAGENLLASASRLTLPRTRSRSRFQTQKSLHQFIRRSQKLNDIPEGWEILLHLTNNILKRDSSFVWKHKRDAERKGRRRREWSLTLCAKGEENRCERSVEKWEARRRRKEGRGLQLGEGTRGNRSEEACHLRKDGDGRESAHLISSRDPRFGWKKLLSYALKYNLVIYF